MQMNISKNSYINWETPESIKFNFIYMDQRLDL